MTDQPLTCQTCGHPDNGPAYHPYAFCVLYKAGLDPWEVIYDAVPVEVPRCGKDHNTPDLPDGYRFIYTASKRLDRLTGGTRPPRVTVSVGGHPHGIVGSASQDVGTDLDIHTLEQRAYDDARQRILTEAVEAETRAIGWIDPISE